MIRPKPVKLLFWSASVKAGWFSALAASIRNSMDRRSLIIVSILNAEGEGERPQSGKHPPLQSSESTGGRVEIDLPVEWLRIAVAHGAAVGASDERCDKCRSHQR
jgi:hypothetical protein